MTLEPGHKLGPYEILAPAGAGGMGEVYQAKDTRLDRVVAIKVLPATTSMNADLRARFQREAKTISSLNHPNICTLFDIGHQEGVDYLVMEYLEGETLADRLKRGPLDFTEILSIAVQVANALDHAHRQSLIHRDLKPGNVILTSGGAKLLDFGLAKFQVSGGKVEGMTDLTQTSTPLTGVGTIIGTIQYMSPEQLEGQEADTRSDIFAFGAMLHEMITGQKAFEGKSQASLIAAIIERDPPSVSQIKPLSPPGLDRLVKKCLAKDPNDRWQSARDLSDELRWISQSGSQAGIPMQMSVRRRFRMRLAWAIAAIGVLASGYLGFLHFTQRPPDRPVVRFTLAMEQGIKNISWPRISPDGNMVAFNADDSIGHDYIWIRPFNSLKAYPLLGTEGANRHYWSPDSKFLVFFAGTKLMKVPVTGGQTQLLCEGPIGSDCSWGTGGYIVFDGNLGDTMRMVSSEGGLVTTATKLDTSSGDIYHAWPWFLPDGDHFLFIANSRDSSGKGVTRIKVGSVKTKENMTVYNLKREGRVEYCAEGYILFEQDNNLMALPFDAKNLQVAGEPRPIAQQVSFDRNAPVFCSSDNGILLYESNKVAAASELVWVDRQGKELGKVGKLEGYGDISLSPDESRLAYSSQDKKSGTDDIWVYDITRDVPTRLTFDPSNEEWPIWSPDGQFVYYSVFNGSSWQIRKKGIDGLSEAVRIPTGDSSSVGPNSITPDGSRLIFTIFGAPWKLGIINLKDSTRLTNFSTSGFTETFAQVSPNNEYVSYSSRESGEMNVYVRKLDGSGAKWQISTGGGNYSQWRLDGKELYYWNVDALMAVPVSTDGTFRAGNPEKLFSRRLNRDGYPQFRYCKTRGGQRFLLNVSVDASDPGTIVVVQNWVKER